MFERPSEWLASVINGQYPKYALLATHIEPLLSPQLPLPAHRDHGAAHIRRVALYAEILSYAYGADPVAAVAAAYCHDLGRIQDGKDADHGRRGWALCKPILESRLPTVMSPSLQYAIEMHSAGQISDDPIVAALWDADRIDLMRFGRPPVLSKLDASRMSRPEAMHLAATVIEFDLSYSESISNPTLK